MQSLVSSGETIHQRWRLKQLDKIQIILEQHESEILQALRDDLGKPSTEAIIEIIALKQELKLAKKNLSKWMSPKRINIPLSLQPGDARVHLEPLGCILIIGPWNYPFSLTIQPLISALAAGNTAVLKPSENSPNTSKLISKLFKYYFSENIVQVFEGDKDVASALLEYSFNHIFFTGGTAVGKKILQAAANHLTPVTLELGGQSPAIILQGADLEVTARRLIWGKGLNAGQTCLAPNHLLVQKSIKDPLINQLKKAYLEFYGPNPIKSLDLAKIINEHHFSRLLDLLEISKEKKQIVFGGEVDRERRIIPPTLIEVDSKDDQILQDELFGPIFPIMSINNLEAAIQSINKKTPPLAIYLFGGTSQDQELLLKKSSSGGVCFNDVIMHAGIPEMPFGGVGTSGMGRYHGYAGFLTFSNQRSVLKRPFILDFKLRYPPYKLNLNLLKKLLS